MIGHSLIATVSMAFVIFAELSSIYCFYSLALAHLSSLKSSIYREILNVVILFRIKL